METCTGSTGTTIWDARNFFEQRKAEFKRNQLGATLGGPILIPGLFDGKDRAWFFLSYQLRSIREDPAVDRGRTHRRRKTGRVPVAHPGPGHRAVLPGRPAARATPGSRGQEAPPLLAVTKYARPPETSRVPIRRRTWTIPKSFRAWTLRRHPAADGPAAPSGIRVLRCLPTPSASSPRCRPLRTYGQSVSNIRTLGNGLINAASIHWFFRPTSPVLPSPSRRSL